MSDSSKDEQSFVSVKERFPALALEWDTAANGDLTPENTSYGSNRRVSWICPTCAQHYTAAVASRTISRSGCPYCAGKKPIHGVNSLAARYPSIAEEWHPERNTPLTADDVKPMSGRLVWWYCNEGHQWPATISSRVNGSKCPVCAGVRHRTRIV